MIANAIKEEIPILFRKLLHTIVAYLLPLRRLHCKAVNLETVCAYQNLISKNFKMSSFKSFATVIVLALFFSACGNSGGSWSTSVPEETTFVILPQNEATVQSAINSEYMPFLEDISAAAVQLVAEIDSNATQSMPLHSILMYPGTDQKMQPIWITQAPDNFLETVRSKYARSFAQNDYEFEGTTILSLQIKNRDFFLASGGKFFNDVGI